MKREIEDGYTKSIEAAQKKRMEQLAALDTLYQFYHPEKSGPNIAQSNNSGYGSLADAVNRSLEFVPDAFTKSDIRNTLRHISPESNIPSNPTPAKK